MNMSEENLSMPRCDIDRLQKEVDRLKKQVNIAIEWLDAIGTFTCMWDEDVKEQVMTVFRWCREAVNEIKELDK